MLVEWSCHCCRPTMSSGSEVNEDVYTRESEREASRGWATSAGLSLSLT